MNEFRKKYLKTERCWRRFVPNDTGHNIQQWHQRKRIKFLEQSAFRFLEEWSTPSSENDLESHALFNSTIFTISFFQIMSSHPYCRSRYYVPLPPPPPPNIAPLLLLLPQVKCKNWKGFLFIVISRCKKKLKKRLKRKNRHDTPYYYCRDRHKQYLFIIIIYGRLTAFSFYKTQHLCYSEERRTTGTLLYYHCWLRLLLPNWTMDDIA